MKRFNFKQVLIAKVAAIALITLCFLQTHANAQEMNGYLVMFPSVGLAHGQRLRFTLFKEDGTPIRAQMSVHTGGMQVALGDGSVRFVNAGIAQSFDLDRDDIPLVGEEGTGRIQLSGSFLIGTTEPALGRITVSMETIKDGTSNTVFVGEVLPSSPDAGGTDLLLGGDERDVLMGVVPGDTLRVTLINPPAPNSGGSQQPTASGHVKIFDYSGMLIAQSAEAVIQSGTFHSFDLHPETFASRGERGTGRRQVRVKPFYAFSSQRLSPLLASFEIVDNRTGETRVLLSGQECLVFYLGGLQ